MTNSFKVIVAGGGPIGLTAAHALHLAGIDFVALERRPAIVEDKGASLVVYPHTFRIMHQFGVLDDLLLLGGELDHHLSFTANGHVFNESPRYVQLRENYGYGPVAFHRAEVIETMYNGLPEAAKQKIFTNQELVDIETDSAGVKVTCSDGSVYCGSIVIGADGVHSKTRSLMRDLALKENPGRQWGLEKPFVSTFRLLFGAFPSPSEPGMGYDVQARNKAIMYFSGPKRGWFFLYEKLPQPTRERVEYTEEDIEALGAEFADFPLTRNVKVKDVWPRMLGKGMTNLEEGIVQHWTLGRIVLVGDSAHKFTTHLGLGFNDGVQDVVVLCNGIQKAVRESADGFPDALTIAKVFETYETYRKGPESSLVADLINSGMETRMHTWATTFYWLFSRYLSTPRCVENFLSKTLIGPEVRKGQVLDYVQTEEPMKGKVSWLHPMGSSKS